MTPTVTALLVSHDGARWLPAVLDGIAAQTRGPDRLVAVDTGSTDATPDLLAHHEPCAQICAAPSSSTFSDAVVEGLRQAPPVRPADGEEWVWLLHDDCAPAPDCLERLLADARLQPSVDVFGPKLREWPSLRRLLEVGVTISGTGRRETGLERGEYDQGQHDRQHDVLAVNTAGMLVRRRVLEEIGFDRRLPIFGNDIDFGWRAARRGHRSVVVPDAVAFHVEAAHRGVRRTRVTGGHRRAERRAALYTLLVNCSAAAFPVQLVRLLFGSLLRAVALVLVRAPGDAYEELLGLGGAYLHPVRILTGRLARRRAATLPASEVRHLLPPWWLPYRHGLDFLADVATAVVHEAGDIRRARTAAATRAATGPVEPGPVAAEAQNLPPDTGLLARTMRSPVAAVFALLVVAALVAARGLVGPGLLSGGALLPAPGGVNHWWQLYLSSWHPDTIGSAAPAPPYLLPLAVAGTILLGKPWLVLVLLFWFAVPLAAWGGYRLLIALTRSRAVSLWGAVSYGLLTVLTGAVQEGRLGTVAAAVVLPFLARSALLLGTLTADRRWRAAWRCALLLALLVSFVPLAWVIAAATALVAIAVFLTRGPRRRWRVSWWAPPLVGLVGSLVLLLPWSASSWTHRGVASWLFEAGLAVPGLQPRLDGVAALFARPGVSGAPAELSIAVVLAGLAALLRRDTRSRVLRAWVVIVVSLGLVAAVSHYSFATTAGAPPMPVYLGFPVLLAQGAAICAAAIAAAGIRGRLAGASFGWRQPAGVVVVLAAVAGTLAGVGWWLWRGDATPLTTAVATHVPAYMSEAAAANPARGVLVMRGDRRSGFDYLLLRGPGLRTGDDDVRTGPAQQRGLTRLVGTLAADPQPAEVRRLAGYGISYVYAPPPADPKLVANLDAASGVELASAVQPGARAWQLQPGPPALEPRPDASRPWLLGLQGVAILAAVVLALPSTRGRRT